MPNTALCSSLEVSCKDFKIGSFLADTNYELVRFDKKLSAFNINKDYGIN